MLRAMNENPVSTAQRADSFTVGWLHEVIQSHASRYRVPPDCELAALAALLSMIDGAYKNRTNLMFAADARYALWILMRFFDEGRRAREKAEIDPRVINLVKEMEAHARAVGMNAGGMMRPYESWRDFDRWIAHGFKTALETSNPGKKIGLTNEGPIARLTAEAIAVITGKAPKVYNVGQHLKQPYKRKRR